MDRQIVLEKLKKIKENAINNHNALMNNIATLESELSGGSDSSNFKPKEKIVVKAIESRMATLKNK